MRLFVAIAMLTLFVMPLHAATTYPCADNTTTCDPWAPDQSDGSTNTGGSSYWLGGDYITCTAYDGQYCYEKHETWNSTTQTWEKRCTRVTKSAHCGCNTKTFEERGVCTYRG